MKVLRQSYLPVLLIIASASPAWSAAPSPSPLGDWARGDGKARVRIAPCGDDLCAVNTWMRADVRNEKVGDRLVMTVTPEGDGRLTGKAFDPQRHMTYHLIMKVAGSHMTTSGCVLGGLICKSMSWTRLDAAP